ncbi:Acetyltransferase (GNAT) domain-containing protein [Cohnella sp. OV330]|uniref:GNAT family N-acetyltransferase n=1 Tax=Cohnella sp. OV330 TaxID=1855288 RepID=UPI0008EFC1B4|nr:GNAT family N-acetyltransferase [Cohnella sp. OV330]SFB50462.1 Acetyltransferase (GNAT) domain-containing protein [Cohnella sp. OV330]
MSVSVLFYDSTNIGDCPWPDTAYGQYARRYLLPVMTGGSEAFVANVRTRLLVMSVDGIPVPVTVNDAEYANSYVCSPYTHYVSYAKEELSLLRNRVLIAALSAVLTGIGGLLKASRFNRVVHVNNWLLSTNLYPVLSDEQWSAALERLIRAFPGHAIAFRSLNASLNAREMDHLRGRRCRLVPSRQIYLLHTDDPDFANAKARWLLKRDRALAVRHGYVEVGPANMTPADIPRMAELYKMLYLDKYSLHNPQFTERFLETALAEGTLELHGYRDGATGRLEAILGFYAREGAMTTPLFGYDTSRPQAHGLYRMLSALLIDIARERGLLLHESSGAAQFKRNRGAVADIEYTALYDGHLPAWRRGSWSALEGLLGKIGVPLMQKYKL